VPLPCLLAGEGFQDGIEVVGLAVDEVAAGRTSTAPHQTDPPPVIYALPLRPQLAYHLPAVHFADGADFPPTPTAPSLPAGRGPGRARGTWAEASVESRNARAAFMWLQAAAIGWTGRTRGSAQQVREVKGRDRLRRVRHRAAGRDGEAG
jgi:hypothetical protein